MPCVAAFVHSGPATAAISHCGMGFVVPTPLCFLTSCISQHIRNAFFIVLVSFATPISPHLGRQALSESGAVQHGVCSSVRLLISHYVAVPLSQVGGIVSSLSTILGAPVRVSVAELQSSCRHHPTAAPTMSDLPPVRVRIFSTGYMYLTPGTHFVHPDQCLAAVRAIDHEKFRFTHIIDMTNLTDPYHDHALRDHIGRHPKTMLSMAQNSNKRHWCREFADGLMSAIEASVAAGVHQVFGSNLKSFAKCGPSRSRWSTWHQTIGPICPAGGGVTCARRLPWTMHRSARSSRACLIDG